MFSSSSTSQGEQKPIRVADGTMCFMFESSLSLKLTEWGENKCQKIDPDYHQCWDGLKSNFDPEWKPQKDGQK